MDLAGISLIIGALATLLASLTGAIVQLRKKNGNGRTAEVDRTTQLELRAQRAEINELDCLAQLREAHERIHELETKNQ